MIAQHGRASAFGAGCRGFNSRSFKGTHKSLGSARANPKTKARIMQRSLNSEMKAIEKTAINPDSARNGEGCASIQAHTQGGGCYLEDT